MMILRLKRNYRIHRPKRAVGGKWAGRVCLTALMVCLLCNLTACHGSKGLPEFEIPESFDTSKEYEITFWAKNDTNKSQTMIYENAIYDFEELYPNITVNLRLYTDYGKIYNDVITNIATNTTPNVCITYPDHIATYRTGVNQVVALDELMTDEAFGLGGSEVRLMPPQRMKSFLNFCQSAKSTDTIMPFLLCAPRRPVTSIRLMWKSWDIRCRMF